MQLADDFRDNREFNSKGGKATGGNYSTVKSAQRLSATSSIRPNGRVQIIDFPRLRSYIFTNENVTPSLSMGDLANFCEARPENL